MDLSKARAVVTGGGSGIGLATAKALAKHGGRVAILGRSTERLARAAREIEGCVPIPCDVGVESQVAAAIAHAERELGPLDVLVNNAGSGTFGPLVETSAGDFERTWRTNTLGAFLVGRECARRFVERKRGSIVNVGSTAARRGFAGGSAYCASKFALSGLTECWRAELRGSNVRVFQVDPSEVQNEFGQHAGRAPRVGTNPSKLVSEDIAQLITSLLALDDRGFTPDVEMWATNPR